MRDIVLFVASVRLVMLVIELEIVFHWVRTYIIIAPLKCTIKAMTTSVFVVYSKCSTNGRNKQVVYSYKSHTICIAGCYEIVNKNALMIHMHVHGFLVMQSLWPHGNAYTVNYI